MKKLVVALATMAVAAVFAGAVVAGTGGTVVASGFACSVLDGNGNSFVTTNSIVTAYDSGKVVMKCNGNGAGAPSLTFFNNANTGLLCGIPGYGVTADWQDKVGYNGNSQLTCTTWASDQVAAASAGGAGIG
jgi:hypothetical protein